MITQILTQVLQKYALDVNPIIDPLGENKTGPVTSKEIWATRYKKMMARRTEPLLTTKPTTHFSPTATWTDPPVVAQK